jgi:hypothetical protein
LSPFRSGFVYGMVAVVIAVVTDLYFLLIDPTAAPAWVLAAATGFRVQLALAAFLFLAILAALRTRPTRTDPDASYRSLLLRDCALAATVVAVMAGATLFFSTAIKATLFAGEIRVFASEAAPRIVEYLDEVRSELSEPPPPTTVEEAEETLQPPELWDLGRSMANFMLRVIFLGAVGALVGALRGAFGSDRGTDQYTSFAEKERSPKDGKSPGR